MPTVDFVENKSVRSDELARILEPSIRENRHTNFGPVAGELERQLTALNELGPAFGACCAANATLALQAIVATLHNTFGRRLRWAVSDFGFFTSFIGPFAEHLSIPCRPDGMISLTDLRLAALDDYDGVLVTNVFGLHEDYHEVFDFCRANRKVLLIDNAAGFLALAPYHHAQFGEADPLLWAEVVSFHHTKAWGMGEGGVAFLPRSLMPTFRAAINFGVGQGRQLPDRQLCTNGKMSEIAAAQILSRVRAKDEWIDGYRRQARRILAIGRAAGLRPLIDALPDRAVPGHVPFLRRAPIALEALDNPHFAILKYYRPSRQSGETSRAIFERILNVPCHPGMAAIDEARISSVLCALADPT
jgi:dTDP-4-amino-4,6-dideoxygalactose transaminase